MASAEQITNQGIAKAPKALEGNVAKVLDETRVVLNLGIDDGVSEGMEFLIYELGEDIKDPVNGKSLGQLEITKGRVQVEHIQPKFCIAKTRSRTERNRVVPWPPKPLFFAELLRPPEFVVIRETLKVEKVDTNYASRLTVKPGDPVREMITQHS